MQTTNKVNCIKIGVKKINNVTTLLIVYSPLKDFLGSVELARVDGTKTLQLDGPVARIGFGSLLMEAALMYANKDGSFIASVRNGDNRVELSEQFDRMYNGHYGGEKYLLPECQNDQIKDYKQTSIKSKPSLYYGYDIKASVLFNKMFVDMNVEKESVLFDQVNEKYKAVFYNAYDTEEREWIDDVYPLSKAFERAYCYKEDAEMAM